MRRTAAVGARVATVVAFLATILVVGAWPAYAFDCKDAPVPEAPGRGVTGFFVDAPTNAPVGPSWVNGAPSYAHYANAGMRFNNYDLGCGPDVANDPGAVISTPIANWILEIPKAGVSGTIAVTGAAFNPDYLGVFNPLLTEVTATLKRVIFDPWVAVTLTIVGVVLLFRARRGSMVGAAATLGWAVLVMIFAAVIFNYPVQMGTIADRAAPEVLGQVHSGINGREAAANPTAAVAQNLNGVVLFEQWKAGTFGDSDSRAATRYARDIYEGQSLTWEEAARVDSDPDGAGEDILDDKADQWEDAAEKIKDEDPDAYAYLTGQRAEARISAAVTSVFALIVVAPFLVVSAMLIIASFLLLRMAVVFAPAIFTVGVIDGLSGMVKSAVMTCAAAVVNCIVFGVGSAVTILVQRIILSPSSHLPTWLQLLLALLTTVIMWVALKPFRRLTQMMPGDGNVFANAGGALGRVGRSAADLGKRGAMVAATGGASGLAAAIALPEGDESDAARGAAAAGGDPVVRGRYRNSTPRWESLGDPQDTVTRARADGNFPVPVPQPQPPVRQPMPQPHAAPVRVAVPHAATDAATDAAGAAPAVRGAVPQPQVAAGAVPQRPAIAGAAAPRGSTFGPEAAPTAPIGPQHFDPAAPVDKRATPPAPRVTGDHGPLPIYGGEDQPHDVEGVIVTDEQRQEQRPEPREVAAQVDEQGRERYAIYRGNGEDAEPAPQRPDQAEPDPQPDPQPEPQPKPQRPDQVTRFEGRD